MSNLLLLSAKRRHGRNQFVSEVMRTLLLCVMFSLVTSASMACQPLDPKLLEATPARVRSNFDGAQFVVIGDVIDVREATVAPDPDSAFAFKVEHATFRVERSFKGKLRPGETFTVDSGFSSCGKGVLDRHRFANKRSSPKAHYAKRWLIYYTPSSQMPRPGPQLPPFEITYSPLSRPVELATYDIDLLMRSASDWAREVDN